jgi:hypothetical protein
MGVRQTEATPSVQRRRQRVRAPEIQFFRPRPPSASKGGPAKNHYTRFVLMSQKICPAWYKNMPCLVYKYAPPCIQICPAWYTNMPRLV